MTKVHSPRRFYIDHDEQQGEPIVRKVSVQRSISPATHQVQPQNPPAATYQQVRRNPRISKLVQSAMRRREI